MKQLLEWLDDRTGIRRLTHEALYENIPGGSRWKFVWGSTLVFAFAMQVITGTVLWMAYSPSGQTAWESVFYIQNVMPGGALLRSLHHYMAQAMVVLLALHLMQVVICGAYRAPREINFWLGMILMQIVLGLSLTGYLLPWDQLALWAVTIGASMIEASPPPIVGETLNLLLRGGPDIGANGLLRFYLLHVLAVPAILFIFTGVHYYKVIIHGHGLPPQKENIGEDTAKRVPLDKRVYFIPDVLTSEMMWIGVTSFILVVLCVWFYHAPLEAHADPQITPLGTTAPWYFLWIQGALKLGDKVLWGIIFPTIVLVFFFAFPYLDNTPSRRYADRRFALIICFAFMSSFTVLSYMGTAEYGVNTTADQEIFFYMAHEPAHNKMGILLPVPYEQLPSGMYTTRQFTAEEGMEESAIAALNETLYGSPLGIQLGNQLRTEAHNPIINNEATNIRFRLVPEAEAPRLAYVMDLYERQISKEAKELYNGWGAVIITDNQANLKRIDLVIIWEAIEIENGQPVLDENGNVKPILNEDGTPVYNISIKHVFIHRDAAFFMSY